MTRSRCQLHNADALHALPRLRDASIDALIADPPYSSGGRTLSERRADPIRKYIHDVDRPRYATFRGDQKDQRSWTVWTALWLSAALPKLKDGAYVLLFTDWRQLPATTDALQIAELTWRGIIAWDKTECARAGHKGYFKPQCEYVAWATKGPCFNRTDAGPFNGCFRASVERGRKAHVCQKPLALLKRLVECVPPGGTVLDPFMGTGTTGEAALSQGRRFVGMEIDRHYFQHAQQRLK
jgi:site-specific DNA-methyltransferase (adenine-specific)